MLLRKHGPKALTNPLPQQQWFKGEAIVGAGVKHLHSFRLVPQRFQRRHRERPRREVAFALKALRRLPCGKAGGLCDGLCYRCDAVTAAPAGAGKPARLYPPATVKTRSPPIQSDHGIPLSAILITVQKIVLRISHALYALIHHLIEKPVGVHQRVLRDLRKQTRRHIAVTV